MDVTASSPEVKGTLFTMPGVELGILDGAIGSKGGTITSEELASDFVDRLRTALSAGGRAVLVVPALRDHLADRLMAGLEPAASILERVDFLRSLLALHRSHRRGLLLVQTSALRHPDVDIAERLSTHLGISVPPSRPTADAPATPEPAGPIADLLAATVMRTAGPELADLEQRLEAVSLSSPEPVADEGEAMIGSLRAALAGAVQLKATIAAASVPPPAGDRASPEQTAGGAAGVQTTPAAPSPTAEAELAAAEEEIALLRENIALLLQELAGDGSNMEVPLAKSENRQVAPIEVPVPDATPQSEPIVVESSPARPDPVQARRIAELTARNRKTDLALREARSTIKRLVAEIDALLEQSRRTAGPATPRRAGAAPASTPASPVRVDAVVGAEA